MSGVAGIYYGTSGVRSILLESDGKILIGGSFSSANGLDRHSIARLNSDGSVDTSFQRGMGGVLDGNGDEGTVLSVVRQADGHIIIGGSFASVNGTSRTNLARLNPDGSLDGSFQPETFGSDGPLPVVSAALLQPDGKLVIGGIFNTLNGTDHNSLARLNTDGSLDPGFLNGLAGPVETQTYTTVQTLALQPDGKLFVGGAFDSVNGTARSDIARLNYDGTLDVSFQNGMTGPGIGDGNNGAVYSIALQSDGRPFVAGRFLNVNGLFASSLVRLHGTIPGLNDPGIAGGQFGFNITGYPGQTVVAEASTNLVNWIPLQTNTLGINPLPFIDAASASFPNRFYRARLQ